MNIFKDHKKAVIISAGVLIGALVLGTGALSMQVASDKILKGVKVANIDLGGMTRDQALTKLESLDTLKNIKIYYGDQSWKVSASDIDLKINYKSTVDSAYNYNRKNGVFTNLVRTLQADFGSKSNVKEATLDYDYKTKKTTIVADEPGKTMNLQASHDRLVKNLAADKFESEMVVKLEQAKFTKADLKGIDTLLGAYSTVYGGLSSRNYNIEKSTKDSSGIVLKPGQEYSFNGLTGEKTIARGYKAAPVIESGKLVMGIGGGVCQTSSTIFNAALLSGLEITNRRSHTIPSDYVNMGRDATVFDGNPGQDLKFKNPFKHNVYIKNYTYGSKVISEIYGSSSDYKNIEIATQVLGSYGGGSKTISDPSLPAGARVVEKYSRAGYNVVTYRQFKDEKGNVVKSEKIGYSNYPAQLGVVRVGAAKAAKPAAKPGQTAKPQQAAPAPSQGAGQAGAGA